MAKTGFFDSDPTAIAKAKELKLEMKKLLSNIEEEDGLSVQTIDQLQEALSAFRQATTMRKMEKSSSLEMLETAVSFPDEFRCPLSNELMRDPVVLASGQVSDVTFWILIGLKTVYLIRRRLRSHESQSHSFKKKESQSH